MTGCMSGVMPKAMASMQESWTRKEEKRIPESQNCRSWKGPLKIIKSTLPAKAGPFQLQGFYDSMRISTRIVVLLRALPEPVRRICLSRTHSVFPMV